MNDTLLARIAAQDTQLALLRDRLEKLETEFRILSAGFAGFREGYRERMAVLEHTALRT